MLGLTLFQSYAKVDCGGHLFREMDIALRMFANCHISPPVGFKHKHAKTNQSSPSESLFSHMHLPGSIVHSISRWHLRLTSSMTKVASLLALDWLWSIWLKQYVKQFRVAKKSLGDWLYQVLLVFSYYCILAQSLAFWRVGWQAGISFAASGVVSPQWVLPRHHSMACDRSEPSRLSLDALDEFTVWVRASEQK